jgi:quercetin dioxygenase-like cupin family protein
MCSPPGGIGYAVPAREVPAMMDVPFLAINTDEIEWDANVALFELPTGVHRLHPNLRVKVLMRDDKRGQVAALVKFPPGYVEPAHQHVTSHCIVVLEGTQHVAGKVLAKGDFHYAPPNTEHGPFSYPDGAVVFGVYRFPSAGEEL